MAHAPSGRNHRIKPPEELNIVPMIDMVTNLMFFLMMFASVLPVVMIDAPLPKIASTAEEVKKAKEDENKMEITISVSSKGFTLKSDFGGEKTIPLLGEGKHDFKGLHAALVALKTKRPNAKEITLLPADDVTHEVMVLVMDASRELVNGDPGYQAISPEIAHKPESQQFNRLFPDVSIGGI